MHFFVHVDGKTVYGIPGGTTVLGCRDDGTTYTLTVEPPENQRVAYSGTYVIERNSKVIDLAELKLNSSDDDTTDDVALVFVFAPKGAIEQIKAGAPTEVLKIGRGDDGDSWTVLVLEMETGHRIEVVTRANSPEVIDFDLDLRSRRQKAAAL